MNPYTEKNYQLVVKGNVKMLTMMDSFATAGSYTLSERGQNAIKPDLQEYVLEEKELKLTEYFDPNTYQLIEYVNKLARIYNRQHICINERGAIKGLLNMPEIKSKWDKLKKELMQVNPIAAFEIIRHKDRELANPAEVIDNLSNAHFMHLFLYVFTGQLGSITEQQQRLVRDRMGIGFSIPVNQIFTTEKTGSGYTVYAEALLNEDGKIDKNLIISVTGEKNLDIKHYTQASFNYSENRDLLSAEMTIFEQLNNDYKSDLYLHLESN
ncbi:hypothetical protein [Pedobacter hartonius]|uniref:Uncharacterized protein n=1 Tax=Pedobacter hartonius TaxID=425514 RepID=A0A1H4H7Q0_9SPHI|nr:hypothetical protein [Pedobacter hartonius]SEB17814.1 hypothetical protein SAMN05443550_11422 [Pedobacter hartonius]